MRRLVLENGAPVETIVIDTGRVMKDHGWRRIVIVTDAWHMRRALYVFRRLGLDASGDSVPRPSDISRLAWARAYAGDRAALIRSAWLFWIGKDNHIVKSILEGPEPQKEG